MEDVDVVGSAAGERHAGPLPQTCGGICLAGEAVAGLIAARLAAK